MAPLWQNQMFLKIKILKIWQNQCMNTFWYLERSKIMSKQITKSTKAKVDFQIGEKRQNSITGLGVEMRLCATFPRRKNLMPSTTLAITNPSRYWISSRPSKRPPAKRPSWKCSPCSPGMWKKPGPTPIPFTAISTTNPTDP